MRTPTERSSTKRFAIVTWSWRAKIRSAGAAFDPRATVDIEQEHAQLSFLARGTGDLKLEHAFERHLVRESRKRVRRSQPSDPVGLLHQRVLEPRLADRDGAQVREGSQRVLGTRRVRRC